MPFIPAGDDFATEKIIAEFKSLGKLEEQLKYVLLHLYSLEQEIQEKFRSQILEYEKILSDVKFMRVVRYRDSLVEDYATEYWGEDYGEEDPFIYNERLEQEITKLNMRLLATIGLVVKSMKERGIVLDENT